MLRRLSPSLWCAEQPARAHGLELGERMAVVELPDGGLLLYGGVRRTEALRSAVDALGAVRVLFAPNRLARSELDGWVVAHPGAERVGSPAAADRGFRDVLAPAGDGSPPPWQGVLELLRFEGIPELDEVLALHRPSRTLLLSDLALCIPRTAPLLARSYLRLNLGGHRFGPTRDLRWLVADRDAARRSAEQVLAWDFDRIVPRHGDVLEQGAKGAFARAFRWLGRAPAWWQ